MIKYLIFTISALIIILLLALCHQNITSEASAQLPIPNVKSNTSSLANPSSAVTINNSPIITIHNNKFNTGQQS